MPIISNLNGGIEDDDRDFTPLFTAVGSYVEALDAPQSREWSENYCAARDKLSEEWKRITDKQQ